MNKRDNQRYCVQVIFIGLTLVVTEPLCSNPQSLQSYNYPNLFIRHYNYLGEITEINSDKARKDATFNIVPGLSDTNHVSLESASLPGYYFADINGRLTLMRRGGDATFDRLATFKKIPGLKDRNWWSFESLESPGHYVRHYYYHLYVQSGRGDLFLQDATFKIIPPFYVSAIHTDETDLKEE